MNYNDLFIYDKLPDPLSQEELYSYFEKMHFGDVDARELIIIHNIKIVLSRVMKVFNKTPYDKKELISIGLIGLIKSVDTFDISKNSQFSSYSIKCIDNEILMFLRKEKKYLNDDSLDRPINIDSDGKELRLEDTLSDENSDVLSFYERKEINMIIRHLVEELTGRDKEIITLYYGFVDNKILTQNEIADKLGISRSYVSKIITKLLNSMSTRLKEYGIVEFSSVDVFKLEKDDPKDISVKMKGNENMPRNLKSIYEYFSNFSREQINEMLSKLTDEERDLITLRYGSDLDNPTTSLEWTQEHRNKFYGCLIPKMKNLLFNAKHESHKKNAIAPIKTKKTKQQSTSTLENRQEQKNNIDNNILMSKEDYAKILELLSSPLFKQLMSTLSPKEAIIIGLKFGYLDGKFYTTEFVANLLGIDELEVIDLTKKVLSNYKENINQIIDTLTRVTTDEPIKLKYENKKH